MSVDTLLTYLCAMSNLASFVLSGLREWLAETSLTWPPYYNAVPISPSRHPSSLHKTPIISPARQPSSLHQDTNRPQSLGSKLMVLFRFLTQRICVNSQLQGVQICQLEKFESYQKYKQLINSNFCEKVAFPIFSISLSLWWRQYLLVFNFTCFCIQGQGM